MPKLIILRGPPAVGKTTLERRISKIVEFDKIDPDVLMNGKGIHKKHYRLFADDATKILTAGRNALITGIFFKDLLDEFLGHIVAKHDPIIVNLYCPIDELLRRSAERDKDVSEEDIKTYCALLFDDPDFMSNRIDTQELLIDEVVREVCLLIGSDHHMS